MFRAIFFTLVAAALFLSMNALSFAVTCGHDETGALAQAKDKELKKSIDVGNKICPVMGTKIDEKSKVTYEYEGKIYNFCCPACVEAFKKDPAKYIKKVEEELQKAATEKPKEEVVDACCAND